MALIKARHRPLYVWFFRNYSWFMLRSHFYKVRFHGTFEDSGEPVFLVGNHFSWWDGFIANVMNNKYFHRRFHIMMLEDQLKGRLFLNKAGAYSINKGGRSVKESLDYTLELLGSKQNTVVMYPQGWFQSLSRSPVKFEKGAVHILKRIQAPVHIVFYAALVDYFENPRPSLDIYFRQVDEVVMQQEDDLEYLYNSFLSDCINQQVPES